MKMVENIPYIRSNTDGSWELFLRIQPSAKQSEIVGVVEGRLKVRLAAQPIENKANIALIAFVAKTLGVSKSKLSLAKGTTSREKTLHISSNAQPEWAKLLSGQL